MKKDKELLKIHLQEVSLSTAKDALRESGLATCDRFYSLRVYEMQYQIYMNLKMAHDIND